MPSDVPTDRHEATAASTVLRTCCALAGGSRKYLPARAMPYTLADATTILVMGLSDLIQTTKTQRLAVSAGDITGMKDTLIREVQDGIEADRAHQRALASELEALRQEARRTPPPSAP